MRRRVVRLVAEHHVVVPPQRRAADPVAGEGVGLRQEHVGAEQAAQRVSEVHGIARIDAVVGSHPGLELVAEEAEEVVGAAHQRVLGEPALEARIERRGEVAGAEQDGLLDAAGAVADADDQQRRQVRRELHVPHHLDRAREQSRCRR